jgi:Secretion system C-terminal sorting domain
LRNPAGNLSDPANWFAGCIGGSPGSAYSACPIMVGTDQPEIESPSLSVYPVPAKDYINIAFTLQNSSKNCILKIYNLMGSEVKSVYIGDINSGINNLTNIDISDTPAGLLILQLRTDDSKENIKIVHLK